jgi:hypothetical protein
MFRNVEIIKYLKMKKIRIKNDISVIWEITYKDENDISQPYNLEGKNITVTLCGYDYVRGDNDS